MKKHCAVIRHIHFEDLGSLLPSLVNAGYQVSYFDAAIDDLSEAAKADLTVVLGGPVGVYDEERYPFIRSEIALIRDRINQKLPTLGICLGAQLIAAASGAKVYPGVAGRELGWAPVFFTPEALESGFVDKSECQMFRWHGDTFDIPNGATLLANSRLYKQIFKIENHVLAFQCHPELLGDKLEYWLIGHAHELNSYDLEYVKTMRSETKQYSPDLEVLSSTLISRWLDELKTM